MYTKYLKRGVSILKKCRYTINGIDCASCAHKIEEHLDKNEYFKNVNINFSTSKISFETSYPHNIQKYLQKTVKEVEPEAYIVDNDSFAHSSKNNIKFMHILLGFILLLLYIFNIFPQFSIYFLILAYIFLLFNVFIKAFKQLFRGIIDENILITISCIGAYFLGEYIEGAIVILLYEVGKLLESIAINNSRKSIAQLMSIKPEYANLLTGEIVDPNEVKIGEVIVIKPGERVPLDGIVIEGTSHLDTSSLTGESKLTKVTKNDTILSGSINLDALIKVQITSKYVDSTVNKILELVETATDKKTKTETFVNKVSKIYTPIVIILAILIGIFLPLCTNTSYSDSIYKSLTFLVISCPCAIAISVPLSYFTGIGTASKHGILIKGSNFLDELRNVDEFVLDKTGTLTTGDFTITQVKCLNGTQDDILKYAAIGESFSNHPIAHSIINFYNDNIDNSNVKDYKEISGQGITYHLDNHIVKIGNAELVGYNDNLHIDTQVFVKVDGNILGYLILSDEIKKDAYLFVNKLYKLSVNTSIFTGDSELTAHNVATKLHIKEYHANMLPSDKYQLLESKINNNHVVAFVGDGVNDAPVIALANIGISMGNGSSAAIEASDIVIISNDLNKLTEAIDISQFTHKIIKQNLVFAFSVKIGILFLSVLGIATMWSAIFADVGVTLLTIFNSLRILKH